MRTVKAKGTRLDLRQAGAALDTGEMFAIGALFGIIAVSDIGNAQDAVAQAQGRFHRVAQAGHVGATFAGILIAGAAHDHAIHYRFHRVHLVAVEIRHFADFVKFAIDPHTHKALLLQVLKDIFVMALAVFDHRRQNQQTGAFGQFHDAIDNLGGRLLRDRFAAGGAVGLADACIKQAQIVINFGDCTHGRAGIAPGAFLVNRNGRTQPFNLVNIGLFHQPQKLAGIR